MCRAAVGVLVLAAVLVVLSGATAAEAVVDTGEVGTTEGDVELSSVDAPAEIQADEPLEIGYTLEHVGGEAVETDVDLYADGLLEDVHSDVTVGAGETTTGTLVFDPVYYRFEPGDTVPFTVEVTSGASATGETQLADNGDAAVPNLDITAVEAPDKLGSGQDLTVEYTVANLGNAEGTERFVDLIVDGPGLVDWHENVTVGAGETTTGTLVYKNAADDFSAGDTIGFEVELFNFYRNESGETVLADGNLQLADSMEYPETLSVDETLEVTYTLENTGDVPATESSVGLFVGQDIDNPVQADEHENVTVPPGESTTGTLTFESVDNEVDPGDTFGFGVVLSDFDEQVIQEITIEGGSDSGSNLTLTDIEAPEEMTTDESLNVTYTIENTGDVPATESAVSLLVDDEQVDSHQNVTVPPGKSTTDTLVYGSAGQELENGGTLAYTVQLADSGESTAGETGTASQDPGGPDLQIASVDAPAEIETDANLTVNVTVENVGNETGTEGDVRLLIDTERVDGVTNVTVGAGETANVTLVFEDVAEEYNEGETIEYTVALSDFNEIRSNSTDVGVTEPLPPGVDIQLDSLDSPEEITVEDILIVSYTVENIGNESGTESVNLVVEDEVVDTDEDIQVDPGTNRTGQLVLDGIDERYDEGDVISFTVELPTFGDSLTDSTDIEGNKSEGGDNGTADGVLELVSIDATDIVDPNTDLVVNYTIQNVGDEPATESFIDLRVDGAPFDTDNDVTVQPGSTVNGSLTLTSVSYQKGETIEYTVELIDFDDSLEGETFAGSVNRSGSVDIQGAVRTDSASVSVVIESIEDLDGTGWLVVENLATGVQSGTVPVSEGDFETVPIDDIGGVQFGDTIEVRMAAETDFVNVLDTTTTTVEAGGNEPISAFVWNPAVPDVGQPVAFDAGNARGEGGNIVEYRWDFTNNGEFDTVTESAVAQYSFESGGTTAVRLVVENDVGLTGETVEQVTVQERLDPAQPELTSLDIAGGGQQATIDPGSADVSVTVTNVGEAADRFDLTLTVGSSVTETQITAELDGGEGQQVTFEDVTSVLDPGTYDITVSAANSTALGAVTVENGSESNGSEPSGEPAFVVSSLETNSPITIGDNLTVTVGVSNTDNGSGTATLAVEAGELGNNTVSVSLDSGESVTRTVTLSPGLNSDGEYNLTASAGNTERNASVTVAQSGDDSSAGLVIVLVLMLVVVVFGGSLFYYSSENNRSGSQTDRL
jgi:uncharacterized repeat protein (TIGR01451 family)